MRSMLAPSNSAPLRRAVQMQLRLKLATACTTFAHATDARNVTGLGPHVVFVKQFEYNTAAVAILAEHVLPCSTSQPVMDEIKRRWLRAGQPEQADWESLLDGVGD